MTSGDALHRSRKQTRSQHGHGPTKGNRIMDKDRIAGSVKQVVGSIKEAAGKVLGDQKIAADGKAEKAAGKLQNAIGSIRDSAREIVNKT